MGWEEGYYPTSEILSQASEAPETPLLEINYNRLEFSEQITSTSTISSFTILLIFIYSHSNQSPA